MFVTPAFAQGTGAAGAGDAFLQFMPFVLIFVVMYFLIIRPQRTAAKRRDEMLKAVRRGDTVVTGGGIVGKVTKADDVELEVEIAPDTRVKVLRTSLLDVRVKGEPVPANTK
ncbi:preprotein translocase subunit YajC [Notoacmeibacter ruber]|uniref:Sec translocon accessory complex subunit YajC n=1 Tax=Notoacmeibacter ruber TaxID=2670375 RepID=A0A3L7JCG5_9HYPH|nr:preprotein translocase subunit YajC [Notoacmeibacter ruber]RLQ88005.1 preprotein translocase subunit YajC [Notoacmeibacter ruber]